MDVVIYKKDLQTKVLYPFIIPSSYSYFIINIMKFDIIQTFDDKFIINIPDNKLIKEIYKDKIWYRSNDRKFAIFDINNEFKVVFQRG